MGKLCKSDFLPTHHFEIFEGFWYLLSSRSSSSALSLLAPLFLCSSVAFALAWLYRSTRLGYMCPSLPLNTLLITAADKELALAGELRKHRQEARTHDFK